MLVLCTLWSANLHAQGTTSSTISGKITGTDNLALIGASIEALHTPSGTSYGTIANDNGFFTIPNVRVGSPYTITITYIGFEELKKENQFLILGQTLRIDAVLSESVNTLNGVEIKADRNALQNLTSGPETRIGKDERAILPTLNRDFTDFTRLTPQAIITPNGGISIAGMNNRYNSIFIIKSLEHSDFQELVCGERCGVWKFGAGCWVLGAGKYSIDSDGTMSSGAKKYETFRAQIDYRGRKSDEAAISV